MTEMHPGPAPVHKAEQSAGGGSRTCQSAGGGSWTCVCGASGAPTDSDACAGITAADLARSHVEEQARRILDTLTPEQLASALRRGAGGDPWTAAAAGLLIAHDHWMRCAVLRGYMTGGWRNAGPFWARIRWPDIRGELDTVFQLKPQLEYLGAPAELITAVDRYARLTALDRTRKIHGSSSQLAILRIAASIAGGYRVDLGPAVSFLDPYGRGMVLTAFAHLLTCGGLDPVESATSWHEYADQRGG